MPGKVYVFNSYNEPITNLSVSGYNAGSIAGWGTDYKPDVINVPRAKHSDDESTAAFAIGDNPMIIPWDSFQAAAKVTIPNPAASNVSLDDDLILYLMVNKAILVTTRGYVLDVFDVSTSKMSR